MNLLTDTLTAPPDLFSPAQLAALDQAEAVRDEIRDAMALRRQVGSRRVLYSTALLDRLMAAWNEVAAVKFDIRHDDPGSAARAAERLRLQLLRLAPKLPPEPAEHTTRAAELLEELERPRCL